MWNLMEGGRQTERRRGEEGKGALVIRVCCAVSPFVALCSSMVGLSVDCVLRLASLAVPVCCSLGAEVQSGRIARLAPKFAGAKLDELYGRRCLRPPALAPPALRAHVLTACVPCSHRH